MYLSSGVRIASGDTHIYIYIRMADAAAKDKTFQVDVAATNLECLAFRQLKLVISIFFAVKSTVLKKTQKLHIFVKNMLLAKKRTRIRTPV